MSNIPEKDALMHFLMRNESMRNLEAKINDSEKITQGALKSALETIIHAYLDLEYKHSSLQLQFDELKKCAQYFATDFVNYKKEKKNG